MVLDYWMSNHVASELRRRLYRHRNIEHVRNIVFSTDGYDSVAQILNENEVPMENSLAEKIPFINKKRTILVIPTETKEKMMQMLPNQNDHSELNAIERILTISNSTLVPSNNPSNKDNQT